MLKDKKALERYVHKQVFPRVSAAFREYLTQFFTTFFNNGYEEGNFSAWDGSFGSATIVTSPVHTGTYSMKAAPNLSDSGCYKNLAGYATVYTRFYVQFANLPSTSGYYMGLISMLNSGGGSTRTTVEVKNSGGTVYWGLWDYAGENLAASGPSIGLWYCAEVKGSKSGTTTNSQLWIDGSSVVTRSVTQDSSLYTIVYTGCFFVSEASTLYMDDFIISDTYNGPMSSITSTTLDGQTLIVTKWSEDVVVQASNWDGWNSGGYKRKLKVYGIVRTYVLDCIEQNVAWASSIASYFEGVAQNGSSVIFSTNLPVRPVGGASVYVLDVNFTMEKLGTQNVRKVTLRLQET